MIAFVNTLRPKFSHIHIHYPLFVITVLHARAHAHTIIFSFLMPLLPPPAIYIPQFGLSSHAFRDIAFRVIGHSSYPKASDLL